MDVIYLDFDGVCHPDAVYRYREAPTLRLRAPGHELFESAPLLEQLLVPFPSVGIVLSTSWVHELGFTIARGALPPALQERVVGATFDADHHHPGAFVRLPRHVQISDDIERRQPTRWLAVDDDGSGWPAASRDRLVLTPSELGLRSRPAALDLRRRLVMIFGNA